MNRFRFILFLHSSILLSQTQLIPGDVSNAMIQDYLTTYPSAVTAVRDNAFAIQVDRATNRILYSWKTSVGVEQRSESISGLVHVQITCRVSGDSAPYTFDYKFNQSLEDGFIVNAVDIASKIVSKMRVFPDPQKKDNRNMDDFGWICHPLSNNPSKFVGFPALFGVSIHSDITAKERKYGGHYFSYALPRIVPCRAYGEPTEYLMYSRDEDPDFFIDWHDQYLWRKGIDFQSSYGFTLGPGLDVNTATASNILSQLLQDLATARTQNWFMSPTDADPLIVQIQTIKSFMEQGRTMDARVQIQNLLESLSTLSVKTNVEMIDLLTINLTFLLSLP